MHNQEVSRAERYARRSEDFFCLAGALGLFNTARVIFDYKIKDGVSERSVYAEWPESHRFPLRLTSSKADLTSYLEVFGRQTYRLPDGIGNFVGSKPIIDIGASTGVAATYFATRHPDSRILAVEPHPRNFEFLDTNSEPYSGQIEPNNSALAIDDRGSVPMGMLEGAAPNNHSAYVFSRRLGEPESYHETSSAILPLDVVLDFACGEQVGLLKIDIEGAEKEIFASGAMDPLLKETRVMAIETHDKFVPGSSAAVDEATIRTGMRLHSYNGHTSFYTRS